MGESCCGTSDTGKEKCRCVCHRMPGILIALIGFVILLSKFQIVSERLVEVTWPTLIILFGLKKAMGKGPCKCC